MKQASSRHCFVCGVANPFGLHLAFYQVEPGQVEAHITVPEHFQGYPGIVHGGVVAAMLDEVTGRSHMGVEPPRFMYTARLDVRYRKNVPVGQPLRLVGTAGKSRNRSAAAAGALYNAEGELLAEADAILVDIPGPILENTNLEALGWKVYPDE
jgi:acyl-coenzyme A thioesterase PaaI-like protein